MPEPLVRREGEDPWHFSSRCKLRGLNHLALEENVEARKVYLDGAMAEIEHFQALDHEPSASEVERFALEVMACLHGALVETKLLKKLPTRKP